MRCFTRFRGSRVGRGCLASLFGYLGVPLRCRYCDTEYAFREGVRRSLDDVLEDVLAVDCSLVELTGGEPLAQKPVFDLMRALCDAGRTVLVETSGSIDISPCDERVIRILDMKTPGSGEFDRNLMDNLDDLRSHDEVKFVITDRRDYDWARSVISDYNLVDRVAAVLLSPVFEQAQGLEIAGQGGLAPHELAEWMLADALPARLQLQMHKFIWDPSMRGV